MTTEVAKPDAAPEATPEGAEVQPAPRGRRRLRGGGHSLLAQGEPIAWLNGGGLVICMVMIIGLLALIVYQGITTFWPVPLVQIKTISDETLLGEVTRRDRYELTYSGLMTLSGVRREAAVELLSPVFRQKIAELDAAGSLADAVTALDESAAAALLRRVESAPAVDQAAGPPRTALFQALEEGIAEHGDAVRAALVRDLSEWTADDETGRQLVAGWEEMRAAGESWLLLPDCDTMRARITADDELLGQLLGHQYLTLLSVDVRVPMQRRLLRTGNYELTNEHFNWVSDFDIVENGETTPRWSVLIERLAWGRFYGEPAALKIDGQEIATAPDDVWAEFQRYHPQVRRRWKQRRRLERSDVGEVNRLLEEARLDLRRVELDHGKDSPQWQAANREFEKTRERLDAEFERIRARIVALDEQNARYELVMRTSRDEEKVIALADVVRAYPGNQLAFSDKLGIYGSRWLEFLTDDPREANSEGGVLPAIWGTVAMTLLMSVAVVPFGVLAALYLREYAKAGTVVSTVRIAVNNLAGVPSIVFGVFGLGFFCYIVGASIDQLLFREKLPSPTFGTGGLMWAALTLALLTLPVVIVATEEALAAVPRSMREGSLACGATKWQTIRRIVLPRAMPGIMTGMILAMARGAGEVAPLMLVGAVKLAPELPVDGVFPFVHLERSFMHLGFHIFDLGFQSQNSEAAKPMVFTTTLLLITLVALMNVLAIWLRARLRRRFEYSQF